MQIWLYDQMVGRLEPDRSGLMTFLPDSNWTASNQVPRLGLQFRVKPNPKSSTGLPHWFENLLPERGSALRSYFNAKCDNVHRDASSTLLKFLGSDLPGAVRVLGEVNEEQPNEADPGTHKFSLAGMQLKFSMREQDGRFTTPARDTAGIEWILKSPGALTNLVENEFSTMAWAKASGFEVPETRVVFKDQIDNNPFEKVVGNKFYAIKRFDRSSEGPIHQEDFAQAMFIHPNHKYHDGKSTRFQRHEALIKIVRDACGEEAAFELARRFIFVIVSGNTDAHMKNWSFIWSRTSLAPQLAPMYDQVCTIAVDGFGYETPSPLVRNPQVPDLALSFGKIKSFAKLNHDAVKNFCNETKIPSQDLSDMARKIANDLPKQTPDFLVNALHTHWERTPWLRDVLK
jgi:serine/threonine-protein kinase HipA